MNGKTICSDSKLCELFSLFVQQAI